MFTTKHLELRGFKDSDLKDLLRLHNTIESQRGNTLGPLIPRPQQYKECLRNMAEGSAIWFTIDDKGGGGFVGYCMVRIPEHKNRDGEFSISLFPRFWGKGYGTEAVTFTVGMRFALSACNACQCLSLKEMLELGNYIQKCFQEEGRKRRGNWAESGWEDIIYMGVLEEEWAALHNEVLKGNEVTPK